ncbi:alpha-L-arabinofuranosidase 1-like [Lotus japonicus]|uniref:alpha-L-arabinofuranosidase 1-like n=1 Tax=Lotus japonicus TaxID=34305 RepID=UPI002586E573|nr:alpha-L-arabinofuranosidase 1-like [Lotus japonicus]
MAFSKTCCGFLSLLVACDLAFQCYVADAAGDQTSTLTVDLKSAGRPIPETLFGVFYEEINHAGTGGLWAELVNNRGFEAGGTQTPSNIAPWTIVGKESLVLLQTELSSCFERNKVALRMDVLCDQCPSDGVGVSNPGYWGMNVVQKKEYKVVFFVKSTGSLDMTISFKKAEDGGILASQNVKASASEVANWKRMELKLVPTASNPKATLHLTTTQKGVIWLDQVSAMPVDTFKGHGFRTDLVNMVLELKPAFIRFPGGCFIEGQTLRNAFRWKDSVGPWEERPGHFGDVWGSWTDEGLGYFEGLQLAEDIGAKPIWVFNNGISHTDQIDTSVITPFVQEALDGIEFARGPATSKWGSLRKSMGHPEPFDLKYVAIGNEDCGKKNYLGNYLAFYNAIRKAYPDIQMISNCDASSKPLDHPADLYDYHTYPNNPSNMFNNAHVFDKTPRKGPKAFVSEYALVGDQQAKLGTLIGGVSEAGFLIGLEKNSDHVAMAAYAPLFVNADDRKWNPDAIVFNSNQVYGTPSYWVTHMFKESNGATFLASTLQTPDPSSFDASTILWQNPQDKKTYLKIKVANLGNNQVKLGIVVHGLESSKIIGTKTVLTSKNALDENTFLEPRKIVPQQTPLEEASANMNVELPPLSVTSFDILK